MSRKGEKQPGWQVVLSTELRRLWLGWRGPLLLLAFSIFLSVYIVLLTLDPEINVLSQRKMIDQTIQATVLVGIIAVLLPGADTFSGERDHRTLESLLLTPVPRGQLVIGKLLAIFSLWLGMIPVAIPYIALVARGTDVVLESLMLLIIPGTFIVWLSAGVGVLVSGLSPTNLVSFTASFMVMLLLATPTQLPGSVKNMPFMHWFIVIDPITAVASYQSAVIGGEIWTKGLGLLLSPVIALVLAVGLGPRFLNSRLSLQGGTNQ
jgi:ABC-2 type transport system permease protein